MKKITRKFVIDYLSHLRNPFHNQAWHDFMNTDEAEAVSFALYELGRKATYSDIPNIVQTAQLYLNENNNLDERHYDLMTTPLSHSNFVRHKATCRLCNAIWVHTEQGPYQCPNGHGHLFCTLIS